MMSYVNAFFGWVWRKKIFFLVVFSSALFFFVFTFPFGDLSTAVTSAVAKSSGNQVYVQFEDLDLSIMPAPAAAASGVSADLLSLPTLSIEYLKLRPAWFAMLFSPLRILKAMRGDMESQMYAGLLALAHVRADGILGGNINMDISPDKVEDGSVTTRTELEIESLDLSKMQDWAELPIKMQGKASADIQMKINPSMREQPEGEFSLSVSKFSLPASTVMIPMGEGASMPMNFPSLSLANVLFRGRLVGGNLIIEEGVFGKAGDPIYGRIKGQIGLRLMAMGPQVVPQFGNYNLSVDLNSTAAIEKEIGIAFLLFQSAKSGTANGSRYLFKAEGSGMGGVPRITRVTTF